jgi:diguanylate cyclase (GGDEF)-like protein
VKHGSHAIPLTVSLGVAELAAQSSPAELFHSADTNLYAAKKAGRNRVA